MSHCRNLFEELQKCQNQYSSGSGKSCDSAKIAYEKCVKKENDSTSEHSTYASEKQHHSHNFFSQTGTVGMSPSGTPGIKIARGVVLDYHGRMSPSLF